MRTFWIAPCMTDKDVFYLFRDEGLEIKFKIQYKRVFSKITLKPEEIAYIYRYFIPRKE